MVATYNFGSVYMLIKFTNHRLKTVNHNNLTNQVAMTYGNTIFILMNYPFELKGVVNQNCYKMVYFCEDC